MKNTLQTDNQKWHVHDISDIDVECQGLEFNMELQCNIVVANMYRPPKGNVFNFIKYLKNVVNQIKDENMDIFIMGDFNIDFLDKGIETTTKLENLIKQ